MIHAYRIFIENSSGITKTDVYNVVDNWRSQNTPWVGNSDDVISVENTEPDGSGISYFVVNIRFELTDDPKQLTQDVLYALSGIASWARVRYHKCDNDESTNKVCSWSIPEGMSENNMEVGTVPSEIPEVV
jgi:hypothetical protein